MSQQGTYLRGLCVSNRDVLAAADLRQAEENEYTASEHIPQIEEQIEQQENALRLLLGQNPGSVAHTDPNALTAVPQGLPVRVPSRLLERRPDILEAEEQLVEANARIGVARAQFFPQVSISDHKALSVSACAPSIRPLTRSIKNSSPLTIRSILPLPN